MESAKKPIETRTEQLTLTKAEIAFLDATIELMREEEEGRVESITINIDPQASAYWKALVKTAKKVNDWVQKNGGYVALATAAVDLFGFTATPSSVSQAQAEAFEKFRAAASQGVSLDDLIELRQQLEGKRVKKVNLQPEDKSSKLED
jgi:hypothetical protein